MKKTKKLFAMFLAMIMVLAMALPVGATGAQDPGATSTGSITINSSDGSNLHEFKAYQIFKGTLSQDEQTLSDIDWGNGISTNTQVGGSNLLAAIQAIEVESTKPFENCATASAVAEALSQYADNSTVAVTFAETVKQYMSTEYTAISATGVAGTYTANGLAVGYYLIIDTMTGDASTSASDLLLKLVGNVTIDAKVGVATVNKYAGDETLDDNTEYGVGDVITYTLVGTLPDDFDKDNETNYLYKFVDIMDSELALTNEEYVQDTINGGATTTIASGVTVSLDGTDVTDQFTITYADNTLTIENNNLEQLNEITAASKIKVSYDAKIVSMPVDSDGITNKVQVTYKTDSQTLEIPETVFPVNLTIKKVDGNDKNILLTGAVFQLSRTDIGNGGNVTEYLNIDENGVMSWIADKNAETTHLTTVDGLISLSGLPIGTYTLTELQAPDGYNKLEGDVTLTITGQVQTNTATGALELTGLAVQVNNGGSGEVENNTVTVTIANNTGVTLPSTGGIGTTIFYIIGGILVIGAGVLLITRKRMSKE